MMKLEDIMKWVVKLGVLAAIVMFIVLPANAAGDSYNAYPNTNQYAYGTDGTTKLPVGSVLQVIYASGGVIHVPNPDGSPSGGDVLIDSTNRTVGNIGGAGYFYYVLNGLTNGSTIYIRTWNASLISSATHYGDSTTLVVNNPTPPNPAKNWPISSFNTNKAKPVLTPYLSSASPSSAYRGAVVPSVAIVGSNTNFTSSSTVNFGTGITVGSVTRTDATHITANNVTIPASVANGLKTVTVGTTGYPDATGAIFTVSAPSIGSLSPASGTQGTSATVTVNGVGSHFQSGVTTVAISGSDVTVGTVTVSNTTTLTVVLNIGASAGTGARTLTVSTALGGSLGTESITSTFTVNPAAGSPYIENISPNPVEQGWANTNMTVTGKNTHFVNGTTTVTIEPGDGMTIKSTPAVSGQTITFKLGVSQDAPMTARTVTVKTGAETVTTTLNVDGMVKLLSVTPSSGKQGDIIDSIAIVGQKTAFTAQSTVEMGEGITIGTVEYTDATHITAKNVSIAKTAYVGLRTVNIVTPSDDTVSGQLFTVIEAAKLLSATPESGKQGETLTQVTIVGQATSFNSTSVVDFGSGITMGTIEVTNGTTLKVNSVVISAAAATGKRNIKVTTGSITAEGEIFTVTAAATVAADTVVIDDFEGTLVLSSSYYEMGPSGAVYKISRTQADKQEGSWSGKMTFSAISDSANAWRGFGGILADSKDISNMDVITFWMKGDGSTNKVKLQLKDGLSSGGDNYAVSDAQAISLSDTSWKKYTVKITDISNRIGYDGNGALDLKNISQYQFVFTGTAASTGVLIDYVVAEKQTTPPVVLTPRIDSITPNTIPVGGTVMISGANFANSGAIYIEGQGIQTVLNSQGTGESNKISTWSADTVKFTFPNLEIGQKTIKIVTASGESNAVTVNIVAQTTGTSYNYPNPFNPLSGASTKIVFDPQGATSANAYIFDASAKVVAKLAWTQTGSSEITWNGYDAFTRVVGDGVYPYRVVDSSSKVLGKGKILVINR